MDADDRALVPDRGPSALTGPRRRAQQAADRARGDQAVDVRHVPAFESEDTDYEESGLVAYLATVGEVQSFAIARTIVSSAYERYREQFPDRGVVVLNSNLLALKGAAELAVN
ncbi:hypothetical protein ACH4TV_32620 [Streptomyces sp. NPDC020898]|uniref:hypothetical protein n=1 Tax=Streptomyces sp. NPDC020898 TaxID=3365101 RepID=UPI003794D580